MLSKWQVQTQMMCTCVYNISGCSVPAWTESAVASGPGEWRTLQA